MSSVDLWPIGNCQVSALIDRAGRFVRSCVPQVDGDPLFTALLDGDAAEREDGGGYWSIELENCVQTTQRYRRNTPILVTRHWPGNYTAALSDQVPFGMTREVIR